MKKQMDKGEKRGKGVPRPHAVHQCQLINQLYLHNRKELEHGLPR